MTVWYHPESDSTFEAPPNFQELAPHDPDTQLCHSLPAHKLPAWKKVSVGFGVATALPDFDFETYSEAGYVWDEAQQKWRSVAKNKQGIGAVGAAVYSEHPTTEVLSLAYDLKDGKGARLWLPCMPPPQELFDYLATGNPIEAHNSAFEWLIWTNVCMRRMGWPPLPLGQLRCSMAKARAFSLPGQLAKAGFMLNLDVQKDKDGQRLLRKFSVPRKPTKKDPRKRIDPLHDPEGPALYSYNDGDIKAESELSAHVPDLTPKELELWLVDQRINMRGVHIDVESARNMAHIFEQAEQALNHELRQITNGEVPEASKLQALQAWLDRHYGVRLPDMTATTIEDAIGWTYGSAQRALQIRAVLSSASVKKLYSILRTVSYDGRLRDLFAFCGADRTGRFSGRGAQPQNLKGSGPDMQQCDPVNGCGEYYNASDHCPHCGAPPGFSNRVEWGPDVAEAALRYFQCRDYNALLNVFTDPIDAIGSSLRGLFVAAPGRDLICSDYSAIEAVVLAALAGEEWRLEVFRTHGKIYEMSASKITGVPFEVMTQHKGYDTSQPQWWTQKATGEDHPHRKKFGKVAELASGYQGNIGAWKAFGADKHLSDDEIKTSVKAWRSESPNIVKFWWRMEDCAVDAVRFPGNVYEHRGIAWTMRGDVLYCRLLSGRLLAYHKPRVVKGMTPWGKEKWELSYLGTDDQGRVVRIDTYGGKLTENVTQATARDILTHALVNAEKVSYNIVLHVHDELCAEVPEGWGSVEEFEAIMADLPDWCRDWPIKAAGGWRGKRFRKG